MKKLRRTLSILSLLLLVAGTVQAQEKIEDGTGRNFNIVTERAAEYPGGNREMYMAMFERMQYPAEAKENKIEGDVMVSFMVEPDSSVSEVKVLKDIGYGTAEEAERLVKTLKFSPALQGGEPVRQNMMISVLFRIYD